MEFFYTQKALKQFQKLDKQAQTAIKGYTLKLETFDNPCEVGKALKGNLKGLWRYRVGDYRLICLMQDKECIILCLELGHRKDIY